MTQLYMTRADEVGSGPYDSIAWLFDQHIKEQDTGEFNYALVHCVNEDSPRRVEFFRDEPDFDTVPDRVWFAIE